MELKQWTGPKVYILDTCVLVHDPYSLDKFASDGNIVVIPVVNVEELDGFKKSLDETGGNVREVSRIIAEYGAHGSLKDGVKTRNGGFLIVDCNGTDKDLKKLANGLDRKNDNRIIAIARRWQEEQKKKGLGKVSIVSKDLNLRIKGNAFGLLTEDYQADKSLNKLEDIYSGVKSIVLPEKCARVFDEIYKSGSLDIAVLQQEVDVGSLMPNQCCKLEIAGKTTFAIYKKNSSTLRLVRKPKERGEGGKKVVPINIEQCFSNDLLMDPDIDLVTLVGKAGTGKTLVSVAAGYAQLSKRYRSLLIYRPNIEIGPGLGFLPGDIGEKFEPWAKPIYDNLRLILRSGRNDNGAGKPEVDDKMDVSAKKIEHFIELGLLEIAPIAYIRGRSLNDAFIIIDDAQNLSPHEIKALLTRPAQNSKVVLTGDPNQIDNPYLDSISNGLVHTVEKFKGQDIFGHVILKKGERSKLADLAANLL